MKQIFKTIYLLVKDRYWKDPVWSKVISAGIIAILTTTYLAAKALIDKISFSDAFWNFVSLLNQTTSVNNLLLIGGSIFIAGTIIAFSVKQFPQIRNKNGPQLITSEKEQLPLVPSEPTVFFNDRLASAFPGQRGLLWYDDPKEIVKRLSILFREPLKFMPDTRDNFSSQPLWWYREGSSMYINHFERLSKTKVLFGIKELEVKRMAVNIDQQYYKCFIYLETKGERQTGLYNLQDSDKTRHVRTFGYSWEEFGLYRGTPIRREEYDDGAATINGKIVQLEDEATVRMRYLTDYNLIIASNHSPYNSQKFVTGSENYFNAILAGKADPESFFDFLKTFKRYEQ